jgi:hypothetical protein
VYYWQLSAERYFICEAFRMRHSSSEISPLMAADWLFLFR